MAKYTAPDYVFQFVTVTVGMFIALFINGMVEWNQNRGLVRDAHASIRREIADNLKELESLPKAIDKSTNQAANVLEFVSNLLSKGKTDIHSLELGFDLATLNESSWQTAERTGALAHMSYEQVKDYSELYGLQELFIAQQRKAVDLVTAAIAITAGDDPTIAPKEDLLRVRDQVTSLRANVFVTGQLGAQLADAYRKFLQSNRP